jgi:myosin heavy subunit
VGKIIKQKSDSCKVEKEDGEVESIPTEDLVLATQDLLESHDNLTNVGELKEAVVLHNLRTRFKERNFYTYIGPILLAVNPYQKLSIYSAKYIQKYKTGARSELPPHVFAIAQEAYRSLRLESQSQSILVSGESGAGKTETTKLLLQHLAVVSGQNDVMTNLSTQILEANPVLEAFGNAKTLCNDNSSRFGKFVKVVFATGGDVIGGMIEQYLLETTRIVRPNAGERNFHIFYQLLRGCSSKEKKLLCIKGMEAQDFAYLRTDVCPVNIRGDDDDDEEDDGENVDEKGYQKVRDALEVLGFEEDEILSVFKVAAAVLHLGNLVFSEGERTKVQNVDSLEVAAKLLCVEQKALTRALTHRKFKGVSIALLGEEAEIARDGFAKAIYTCLFEWLVSKINDTIKPEEKKLFLSPKFIGLLDIFGFESFERNSLEQLLINGTNETLQFQFNKVFFQHEQEEYKAEGLSWTNVKFKDNTPCVELIDAPGSGILRMLSEEGRLPQCSDERLLTKMNTTHAKNKFYSSSKKDREHKFEVHHYARKVTYDIRGFLEKNKDNIVPEILALVEDSTSEFLRKMFEARDEGAAGTIRGNKSPRMNQGNKRKPTITEKFLRQLASLSIQLDSTHRHYIRCLRPNKDSMPKEFHGSYMLEQMLSSGVMETIMIRKAGFGHRILFSDFANSFRILLRKRPEDPKELTALVAKKKLATVEDGYKLGISKVFLTDEAKSILDAKMEILRKKAGTIILHAIFRAKFKTKYRKFVKKAMKAKKKREEEERRRKEEEERKRREEEERIRKEEEERQRKKEEKRRRKEEERIRREKEEEEERIRQEEEEERIRQEEEEYARKLEEERIRKEKEEEEERIRKEEEEEERQAAEKKRREEEEEEDDLEEEERLLEEKRLKKLEQKRLRDEKAAEIRRRAQSSLGRTAGSRYMEGSEDLDSPRRRTKTSMTPEPGRRKLHSIDPSSVKIRSKSGIGRGLRDASELADSSNGTVAFENVDLILSYGLEILQALKQNDANKKSVKNTLKSMQKSLELFLEEGSEISDTRTFARACLQVEDQTKSLISVVKESLQVQSSVTKFEQKASLQTVESSYETLSKLVNSWKQKAIALGKNISVNMSSPFLVSAKEDIPRSPREKERSPREKERSPREKELMEGPKSPRSPASRKKTVKKKSDLNVKVFTQITGTVVEDFFAVTESPEDVKKMILAKCGKQERHCTRYMLNGTSEALKVSDDVDNLLEVVWIEMCVQRGVYPTLEMVYKNDDDEEDEEEEDGVSFGLLKMIRYEKRVFGEISPILGDLYVDQCLPKMVGLLEARGRLMEECNAESASIIDKCAAGKIPKSLIEDDDCAEQAFAVALSVVKSPAEATLRVCVKDSQRNLCEFQSVEADSSTQVVQFSDLTCSCVSPGAFLHFELCGEKGKVAAWCTIEIFDISQKFVEGRRVVRLWDDRVLSCEAFSFVGQDFCSAPEEVVGVVEVELQQRVQLKVPDLQEIPASLGQLDLVSYSKIALLLRRADCGTQSMNLSEEERKLVFENRMVLTSYVSALPAFIKSVPWEEESARTSAYSILNHWDTPEYVEAIALLGPSYSLDPLVRRYACSAFDTMGGGAGENSRQSSRGSRKAGKSSISHFVSLLVCALRFEPGYYSDLHVILLSNALKSEEFALQLFWELYADLRSPIHAHKAGFLIDLVLRWVSEQTRARICGSVGFVEQVVDIFEAAQNGKSISAEIGELPRQGIVLPFIGSVGSVSSFQLDEKKNKLVINFSEPLVVSSNAGDDYVALQLVKVMCRLWKLKGRDLDMTLYDMVKVKENTFLSSFPIESGEAMLIEDAMGAELSNFLDDNNDTEAERTQARENLQLSCAGLAVTSFLLGEALLDSIYLLPSGKLFQARHSVRDTRQSIRDAASTRFILAPPVAHALGYLVEPTVDLACRALNCVRKNAWIVSSVMGTMPESASVDNRLMEIRLKLNRSTEEVLEEFAAGLLL